MARAMSVSLGSASRNSGDSLRLPGAVTNGAMMLQSRSQKATTLQPLRCLCPLYPRLSVSASRGPFRFFWTTECEAGHAIRFGDFSLPGNDVAQALHGNDGEENRDGTDSSRAAGRLPRETRDGRQRWQWGATAEHVGDH